MRAALGFFLVVAIVALCGAFFAIFWKSNQNCEATLIFAQEFQRAVNAAPNQTAEQRQESDDFFNNVYSKLNC